MRIPSENSASASIPHRNIWPFWPKTASIEPVFSFDSEAALLSFKSEAALVSLESEAVLLSLTAVLSSFKKERTAALFSPAPSVRINQFPSALFAPAGEDEIPTPVRTAGLSIP